MMLDYLLAIDLMLLTAAVLTLVWKCFNGSGEARLFAGFMTDRIEVLGGSMTEVGAILEDIATALEQDSPGPARAAPGLGGSPLELLGNLLMAKASIAPEHGEAESPVREVHEGEQPEAPE
jgi:hypothetical protein